MGKEQDQEKILLHTDASLSKEIAEEINKAVGKIGPIEMAGLGLVKKIEHTTEAMKEGIQKIEEAKEEFIEAIPDSVLEEVQASGPDEKMEQEIATLKMERDHLKKENTELKEKKDI